MQLKLKMFYWVFAQYMEPGSPGWHLNVEETAETMDEVGLLGGKMTQERQMTIADAGAAGISLATIGAAINEDIAVKLEAAYRRVDELTAEAEAAAQTIDELTAEAEAAAQTIDELTVQLEAATGPA